MEDMDFTLDSDEEEEDVGGPPSSSIQITKDEPGTVGGDVGIGDDDEVMVLDDDEDAGPNENNEAANKFIPRRRQRVPERKSGDNTVFARVVIENPVDRKMIGKPQEFELDPNSTFNVLLMRMMDVVHEDFSDLYSFHKTATDEDQEEEDQYAMSSSTYDLEDKVPVGGEIIYFRPRGLLVGVMHLQEMQVCHVLPTHTPADIRERFNKMIDRKMQDRSERNLPKLERGTMLSYESKRIEEHQTLASIGVRPDSETIVVGLHAITVRDDKCGLEQELKVNEFTTIHEVLQQYCEKEQREFRPDGMRLDNQGHMPLPHNLIGQLEPKVLHNHLFLLDNHSYTIEIKDRGSGLTAYDMKDQEPVKMSVEDNWTLSFVKETYSQQPGVQQMLVDDKFHIDDAPAAEDTMLCRLRLTEGSVIYVERAEEAVALSYICANCGGEVLLKPQDVVKCRRCFHRIMYKRRTPKVCQYNCR